MMQLSAQMDPEQQSLHCSLLGLTPSRKSLYEIMSVQNRQIIHADLEFLGAESFAGQTIATGRKIATDGKTRQMVTLLQRDQNIAGCLLLVCSVAQMNALHEQLALLYADLIATTFREASFAKPADIHLSCLPERQRQHALFKKAPSSLLHHATMTKEHWAIEKIETLLLNAMKGSSDDE